MPELPEAETIARTLARAVAGSTIRGVRLLRRDLLKTGSPRRLRRLAGRKIAAVGRVGKYVVLEVPPSRLVLQLGMSGRVHLQRAHQPLPPHTHLVIALTGRRDLRYANVRRIASGVHLLGGGEAGPLGALGPDALDIGAEEFLARVGARTAPVKAVLMNQSVLAGVGNIYADEALFRAGIRPTRRAHRVAAARLRRLHAALRAVLRQAVDAGGSTVSFSTPFADADGELGYFTVSHRVYGRYGRPCRKCRRPLSRTTVAGRTTTYCRGCQR